MVWRPPALLRRRLAAAAATRRALDRQLACEPREHSRAPLVDASAGCTRCEAAQTIGV